MAKSERNVGGLKDVKAAVEAAFADALGPKGFVHRPKRQRFERAREGVVHVVHLNYADDRTKGRTLVSVGLAIRFDAVEELANAVRADLSDADRAQTATLGTTLGALAGRGFLQFSFDSVTEVGAVAQEILPLFTTYGEPYFERHSSLEAVAARFASDSFRDWHQTAGGRALRYPAVLALLGRTAEATNAVTTLAAALGPQDEFTAGLMPDFARTLAARFPTTS